MSANTSDLNRLDTKKVVTPDGGGLPTQKLRWHAPVLKRLDVERTASGHSGRIESAHSTS
jgi:hypothetical protein